ncbi:hypothetical protein [Thermodesulfatator atlanticus]|uniref:hypothetical protein n=1 Tax=Thermodesulfatator atlanticus TaxID=501497 RepID=UPI0003B5890F|nr:hypothetical protein [Thermodesulfatator atlanticus]
MIKKLRLEDAEKEENRYYQNLSIEERIRIFEVLRRRYAAVLGRPFPRVERVLKIVKQTSGRPKDLADIECLKRRS